MERAGRGFRPRPVEITQRLLVLRSTDELDSDAAASRPAAHGHATLDGSNEEVLTVKSRDPKQGKTEEIPTPEVWAVPSYESDYRPAFRPPASYIRGAPPSPFSARGSWAVLTSSPAGYKNLGDVVEYDLDNDDEDWLAAYNGTQSRLPPERMELMLWKLEVTCAAAQAQARRAAELARIIARSHTPTPQALLEMQLQAAERSQAPPGYADKARQPARLPRAAAAQPRCQVAMAANTAVLSREAAYEAMRGVSQRPAAIAAVYAYWLAKRKRLGKPVLRRLQPPPAVTDPNPFAVFRPREKVHRPQTRRRRENDSAAFTRMRNLRGNLDTSRAILEWLQRRERRKRDILACEMESQLLQLRLRHDSRLPPVRAVPPASARAALTRAPQPASVPAAEPEHARVKLQLGELALGEQQGPPGGNGAVAARAAMQQLNEAAQKREKKRRRDGRERRHGGPADFTFVPPPEQPEPEMPCLGAPDFQAMGIHFPAAVHSLRGRARFGRGGRIVFDRVDPLTHEPIGSLIRRPGMEPGRLPRSVEPA